MLNPQSYNYRVTTPPPLQTCAPWTLTPKDIIPQTLSPWTLIPWIHTPRIHTPLDIYPLGHMHPDHKMPNLVHASCVDYVLHFTWIIFLLGLRLSVLNAGAIFKNCQILALSGRANSHNYSGSRWLELCLCQMSILTNILVVFHHICVFPTECMFHLKVPHKDSTSSKLVIRANIQCTTIPCTTIYVSLLH